MKIRDIDIDFTTAKVHWAPNDREFAQFWNATSTFLPYLEPFLNKTIREGMNRLPADATLLREHCRIFIAQEGRHYRNHAKFNQLLRDSGYPELAAREAAMKADYDFYWAKKGFKFCLGYAEGFETLGPIMACFFLEGARELEGEDIDDPTLDLWRWHLAEEYEHRHVANYVFHAHVSSYWYRLYGIVRAAPHMLGYMTRTGFYMLGEDYRAGRIQDPWRSRMRMLGVLGRLAGYVVSRLLKTLHPKYDPANLPAPTHSMEVLARAEAKWVKPA